MEQISTHQMIQQIAKDYNIDYQIKEKQYYNEFPIKNGKRKIHSYYNSIIVDREGNEHPYMLNRNQRNEEKLIDFDYIYFTRYKTLSEILKESNAPVHIFKCKICEGNGWYSEGRRYEYKNLYCKQ